MYQKVGNKIKNYLLFYLTQETLAIAVNWVARYRKIL